jgi:hypothetical protein
MYIAYGASLEIETLGGTQFTRFTGTKVLILHALLVQVTLCIAYGASLEIETLGGTRFTCFTGTKVLILHALLVHCIRSFARNRDSRRYSVYSLY